MNTTIYTYGYEGHTIEAFIARLMGAGVNTIVDVRAMPISRKRGFSKTTFANALHAAGLVYSHFPAMGCPRPVRDRYKADGDWKAYTTGFLEYLAQQADPVVELAHIAQSTTCCLVCFEADFNRCHRLFVARAMARAAPLRVVHLTARGSSVDFQAQAAA